MPKMKVSVGDVLRVGYLDEGDRLVLVIGKDGQALNDLSTYEFPMPGKKPSSWWALRGPDGWDQILENLGPLPIPKKWFKKLSKKPSIKE